MGTSEGVERGSVVEQEAGNGKAGQLRCPPPQAHSASLFSFQSQGSGRWAKCYLFDDFGNELKIGCLLDTESPQGAHVLWKY